MTFGQRLFFLCFFCASTALHAQDVPLSDGAAEVIDAHVSAAVVEEASRLGLVEAEAYLARRLESAELSEVERIDLNIERMAMAIQRRDWAKAAQVQADFPEAGPKQSTRRVLGAMLAWGRSNVAEAAVELARVDLDFLEPRWLAWYWTLRGMLNESAGELGRSAESYNEAARYAAEEQEVFLDLLRERNRILVGRGEANREAELIGNIRDYSGEAIAHQYAEQLLLLYIREGQFDKVRELLAERRGFMVLPRDQVYADQSLVIEALMNELQGQDVSQVLLQLLSSGRTPRVLRIGLEMLVGAKADLPADVDLAVSLKRWSEQLPVHPIRVDVLYEWAVLSLENDDFAAARLAAQAIIEEFPGSGRVLDATRLNAWVDWEQGRYRSAAASWEGVRSALDEGARAERARISARIADAYFLASDYDLAASNYAQALDGGRRAGLVLVDLDYQRVLSLLRARKINDAIAGLGDWVDRWGEDRIGLRWRLEWNLAMTLTGLDRKRQAQRRVAELLADPSAPEGLIERFMWLNTRLLFELGSFSEVIEGTDNVLGGLDVDLALSRSIAAELLLLQARARLRMGEDLEAIVEALEQVRAEYAETSAAPETLWVTSRALSQQGRLADAEEAMNVLATEYPGTQWSRMALFESASLAEAHEDFAQAASRLEEFVAGAPEDPMVFVARLNQADLLRKTGNFDEARVLLETVLADFPEHPERYLAEMIRADMLAAEPEDARLQDAVSAYTRLLDLPDIPVDLQMEAGYKLGEVYQRLGDSEQAVVVWLEGVLEFESQEAFEWTTGPYWVGRSLFRVARISEEQGSIEAAISTLRRLITLNLPGRAAAEASLQRLRQPLVNLNAGS